jgi:hypothetical protein
MHPTLVQLAEFIGEQLARMWLAQTAQRVNDGESDGTHRAGEREVADPAGDGPESVVSRKRARTKR